MRLGGVLRMPPGDAWRFLEGRRTGRIATVDGEGFPQVIPMNFACSGGSIYMHSHVRGEKLDNMARDPRAGFEADEELEFLPSYFEDPEDASQADTLYASVVAKGEASLVSDRAEKVLALNALMAKYQPEGRYRPVAAGDAVLGAVAVIRMAPRMVEGKYKIGQHLDPGRRDELARHILGRGSATSVATLRIMGYEVSGGEARRARDPSLWPDSFKS
ncbi:MAG: pyridoxamine 5'-phosphate oxidase family protein [Nitrosopumilus sp.]|nr:pyridoxamine 5'-phosphate oxidase family protein [Nitrosopumilus sp.]MDA7997563.1 pyridoxamine 5'-phosphate oxidase family protein [Nitrosopumilus sp.]